MSRPFVDADPGRLALSELESMTVVDAAGAELGELLDVLASLSSDPPAVTAFIVDRDDEQLRASWAQIGEIDVDGRAAAAHRPARASSRRRRCRGDEIALVDAVLDHQVLDMSGASSSACRTCCSTVSDDRLVVHGVDAARAARSCGASASGSSRGVCAKRPGDFVPWDDVNLIAVRLSRLNFIEAFTELAELHPADSPTSSARSARASAPPCWPR